MGAQERGRGREGADEGNEEAAGALLQVGWATLHVRMGNLQLVPD